MSPITVRGGAGIFVHDRGFGQVVKCAIHHNALSGVEIVSRAAPTVQDCCIYANERGWMVDLPPPHRLLPSSLHFVLFSIACSV
jgi:hypothetical protein